MTGGRALAIAGILLMSGASLGALVGRSDGAVRTRPHRRQAGVDRRRPRSGPAPTNPRRPRDEDPPVDAVSDFLMSSASEPPLLLPEGRSRPRLARAEAVRAPAVEADTFYPNRSILKVARRPRPRQERVRKVAESLDPRSGGLRRRRASGRRGHGPARDPLRARARARDEDVQDLGAEGRSLVRARDDRNPHPGPDSGQAGGRRRGPNLLPNSSRPATFSTSFPARQPAVRLVRPGHLGQRRVERTRPNAAPPDRRNDRLR